MSAAASFRERHPRVASSSSEHEGPGRHCCREQVPAIEIPRWAANAQFLHAANCAGVSWRLWWWEWRRLLPPASNKPVYASRQSSSVEQRDYCKPRCQWIEPFPHVVWSPSIAKERSPKRARVAALSETILSVALQKAENDIYQRNSISRCALLNAPAGSFSKDIDEVEAIAWLSRGTRSCALENENDDRHC